VKVEFNGFVSERRSDGSTLELSRFLASCCAADAVPYSVDVIVPEGTAGYEDNQWLQIRGEVAETGSRKKAFQVVAEDIERIDRPADAYG
jgi:uncharacterized repeat protein (TIGR03943 family)